MNMAISDHDRAGWSRMADAAYRSGYNGVGHRYSALSALPRGASLPITVFDTVQANYRKWLCFNEWPGLPNG